MDHLPETAILPPNANEKSAHKQWLTRRRALFAGSAVCIAIIAVVVGRVSFTFQRISTENGEMRFQDFPDERNFRPHKDADRVNVLLLGIRGAEDPEGGLLTDAMVVASVHKSTNQAALISVPRDLWVRMPGRRVYDKINAAYALGYEEGGVSSALDYAKSAAERVTGLAIDGVVSANLAGVREFVDALGGVSLTLDKPFLEDRQWVKGGDMGTSSAFVIRSETASTSEGTVVKSEKWVFELPAGTLTLDGNTALYYIRARFSSSDFDRARREQHVLIALRQKTKSLGVLLNPVRLHELLQVVERNVATDISIPRVIEYAALSSRIDMSRAHHIVLDSSEKGLLKIGRSADGRYILLPAAGNFEEIRRVSREVFVTP